MFSIPQNFQHALNYCSCLRNVKKNPDGTIGILILWVLFIHAESIVVFCFLLQHPQSLALQSATEACFHVAMGITILTASSVSSLALNGPCGFILNQ